MLSSTYQNWLKLAFSVSLVVIAAGLLLQPTQVRAEQLDDAPVIVEDESHDTTPSEETSEDSDSSTAAGSENSGSQMTDEATTQDSDEASAENVQTPVTPASVPESFEYVAIDCNNLTQLVRRSVQIFDAESDEVELSPAAIIFAETNIVQKMGSFQLDIGDKVSVPRDLVAQYAQMSAGLSEIQLAAWDRYAQNVNFELVEIAEPTNITVAPDNTITPVDEAADEELSDESPLTELEAESEQDNASVIWWFVGIGAVLLLWYILWRRPEEQETPRRKSK